MKSNALLNFFKTSIRPFLFLLIVSACQSNSKSNVASQTVNNSEILTPLENEWLSTLKSYYPSLKGAFGEPVLELQDISLEALNQHAQNSKTLLDKLHKIELSALDHEQQLTYGVMEFQMNEAIQAPQYYHLQFDVTPYQLGFVLNQDIPNYLNSVEFRKAGDTTAFLNRLKNVALFLTQLGHKSLVQTERGIMLPKQAIKGVQELLISIEPLILKSIDIAPERLKKLSMAEIDHFKKEIKFLFDRQIKPAHLRVLNHYDQDYLSNAPEKLGLSQYPGGKEYYQYLIKSRTTLDLSPGQIHERGLKLLAQTQKEMKVIRDQLGFEGSAIEFHQMLKEDRSNYVSLPEELESLFTAYAKRIEPHIPKYFDQVPKAEYGVKRLNSANESGMTYGFYAKPSSREPKGIYYFNGSNLDKRPVIWLGSLTYHELLPGHHFHLASQQENTSLSDFRQRAVYVTAFTEGWGDYASTLAKEMGMLSEPMDHYGQLIMDSFITTRLVVDTGLNYFGWSYDRAKQFMVENTFQSEQEIESELLRYGTDWPAQALAYKLGSEHILNLRTKMRALYGERFDIRDFHSAVLSSGKLPLQVLTEHVKWFLDQKYN